MKKTTLFLTAFLIYAAAFCQTTSGGRFSLSFSAGGGTGRSDIPGYSTLSPQTWIMFYQTGAGFRFWRDFHLTSGLQYDTRYTHFRTENQNFGFFRDHALSMLTVPLGLQFRLPWVYAGAGIHYSTMVAQRRETRPFNVDYYACYMDGLPGDFMPTEDMYTYMEDYQTFGCSFRLGFTPPLFGGLRALLECRYSADLSETEFPLPRFRGFSGSMGLLYQFGKK